VQTPFSCCSANIWEPLGQAVNDLHATLVIRGQRASDVKRAPIKSGTVLGGIEYWFPLEAWSEHEVRTFLEGMDVPLPESYGYFNSSMDCMTCTAYLGENIGKVRYLRERYPLVHEVVKGRMAQINAAVQAELDVMQKAMAA
jgi:phosphoadenosine phosphosulfate reductase